MIPSAFDSTALSTLGALRSEGCLFAPEPFFPTLGNETFFLRLSGQDITGFRPTHASPSFFSLYTDMPSDPFDVRRYFQGDALCHTVTLSPDGQDGFTFCDSMSENEPLFCRSVKSTRRLSLTLSLPSYVETSFDTHHPFRSTPTPCLRLTVRRGFPLGEGFVSPKDDTLLLFATGNVRFDGERFLFDKGESALYVTGNDIRSATHLAETVLKQPMPQPRGEELSVIDPAGRRRMLLSLLLAHQAADGGLVRSFDRPFVYSEDLPLFTAALCQSGHADNARRLLLFIHDRYQYHKRFYPLYGVNTTDIAFGEKDDLCGLFFAGAALLYLTKCPDPAFFRRVFSTLTAALSAASANLVQGALPFMGRERLFEEDPYRYASLFDLSLVNTLLFMESVEAFLTLCDKTETPCPRKDKLTEALAEAKGAFGDTFLHNGQFCLNAPRAATCHRPRFATLVCLGCLDEAPYPRYGIWEKDKNGVYLCPSCLAARRRVSPTRERFGARDAYLALSLSPFGRCLLADKVCPPEESAPVCYGYRHALSLVVDDAWERVDPTALTQLDLLTSHSHLLPTAYSGKYPLMATPDPLAAALLLLKKNPL